jgi:hypothetical protein
MSTVKATNFQHPSAPSPAITLDASGGITLPSDASVVRQIVSATSASDQTTTSSSFIDVTGLSVTLTPTSVASKILVVSVMTVYSERTDQNSTDSYWQLTDGSDVALEGAEGMRVGSYQTLRVSPTFRIYSPVTLIGLAEPATTSPVTYKARFRRGNDTAVILGATNTSKIYAIEFAG